MQTISIQVSQAALDNFKKIVEAQTGFVVTDSEALLRASLQADADTGLEAYSYMVAESECMYENEWPGLQKIV